MSGPARPSVAVVVVARNEAALIGRCIGSIARQTRMPDKVILVDDGNIVLFQLGKNVGINILDLILLLNNNILNFGVQFVRRHVAQKIFFIPAKIYHSTYGGNTHSEKFVEVIRENSDKTNSFEKWCFRILSFLKHSFVKR